MSVKSTAGLTGRMLRTRPGASLLVAVLSFLVAAIVAAVPIALTAVSDATARSALAALSPGARDLQSSTPGLPTVGPDTAGEDLFWGQWTDRVLAVRDSIDDPLHAVLGDPHSLAHLPLDIPVTGGEGLNLVRPVIDPHFRDHGTLLEGRWPEPREFIANDLGIYTDYPLEIALSADTARLLGAELGVLTAPRSEPDDEEPSAIPPEPEWEIILTGIFEAAPGSEDYWHHATGILSPQQEALAGSGAMKITGTGFIAPEMLAAIGGNGSRTETWIPFDPSKVDAADAEELLRQLRQVTARSFSFSTEGTGSGEISTISFRTSVVNVLEEALSASSAMSSVIMLSLSAPAGAAVAVTALACRVVARSRRQALALLATRGASPRTLRGMLATHGAVLGILPAALGAGGVVLAALGTGMAVPPASPIGAAVVALIPGVVLAGMTPPAAGLREAAVRPESAKRRRVLLESVVLATTLLATTALVTQALSGARLGDLDQPGSAEVLAASVPLLWGLSGCVLALRLAPVLVRILFARARRGTRLVSFLGAARTLRERAMGVAPALALVIGLSSAVGSGVLYGSIQQDLEEVAERTVGADLQIAQASLDDVAVAAIREIEGVDAVAEISVITPVTLRAGAGARVDSVSISLLVADLDTLRTVQLSTSPLVPADLDTAEMPIILSARTSSTFNGETEITLSRVANRVPMTVVGVSDAAPTRDGAADWALIDRTTLEELDLRRDAVPSAALLSLRSGSDPAAVIDAIREIVGPTATILTPPAIVSALTEQPETAAVRTTLILAALGVALLAALAVVLTLTLASPGRERILALLNMLGASSRTGRGLVSWELGPPLVSALIVGLAIGLTLPALLLATIDLSSFTGSGRNPVYHLDPLLLASAIGGFLLVTAVLTALALLLSRRARLTVLLRAGQEG